MKQISIEKLAPYLLIIIFALVFFIGFSWQRILEFGKSVTGKKTPTPIATTQGSKLGDSDLKGYAKNLGFDTDKFNSCLDSNKYQSKIDQDFQYASDSLFLDGTPEFFLNGHLIDATYPYQVFKDAIDFELSGGNWNNPPASISADVSKDKIDVDLSGGQGLGDKNAKVTLVEFADFECPYCGQFFREAESQIIKDYVDTGKVYFVFKNYPIYLSHPDAYKAAEAGECAAEQGKFWEMHDAMFKSQG